MTNWLCVISSAPTENATARMRAWRTLKASGSAVLRDGVYLLPDIAQCRVTLDAVAEDVTNAGGAAMVIGVSPPVGVAFETLFDRTTDYAELLQTISQARAELSIENAQEGVKQIKKLPKSFAAISDTDFFPGEARRQVDAALLEIESAVSRLMYPDEPHSANSNIARLRIADYQKKTWATRKQRPWVDRLASAWLILRFIDAEAQFKWIESPAFCPKKAVGFDFDGAAFTHVGSKVTFEVLMASFGLEDTRLSRIGALVHFLDVGGVRPEEAAGIESVLSGFRATMANDDQLLAAACAVFDRLMAHFPQEVGHADTETST